MNYVVATEHFFKDRPGGSGRIAWELAKLVRAQGHRVGMLCGSTPEDPPEGISEDKGITVVRYRFPALRRWDPRRLAMHIEVARQSAERYLGGERWDVVHGHNLAPALAAFRSLGARCRRIATVHSPAVPEQRITWSGQGWVGRLKLMLGEPMLHRAEARLYQMANDISALSDYTIREMASSHSPELAARITRIPWWQEPCDLSLGQAEARSRLGWPLGKSIFFTLRRLVPRTGVDVLIDAVEQLPPRGDFEVYVAGEGPERKALQDRAASGRHASRVHFVGRVADEYAALAYRGADAFVLPTRALECFGIIALEALARGRPVLASRVGAIPEILEPILPGCLFDADDSARLAGLMRAVMTRELKVPGEVDLAAYVEGLYGRSAVSGAYLDWIEGGVSGERKRAEGRV